MVGLVLALAGEAGAADGVTGAAAALIGLRLGADVALLRGAFTGILEAGAALEAVLVGGLTAGFFVCFRVVVARAEVDESFMENQP